MRSAERVAIVTGFLQWKLASTFSSTSIEAPRLGEMLINPIAATYLTERLLVMMPHYHHLSESPVALDRNS